MWTFADEGGRGVFGRMWTSTLLKILLCLTGFERHFARKPTTFLKISTNFSQLILNNQVSKLILL